MDTTKAVTHVSLCAGYGGIDLGLKRCIPNLRTICFSEIEAFACELLLSRMEAGQLDAAPIWSDLKSFPWEAFRGKVHILSGGYPCQPFSAAGLRKGADDPRHLWPYIADGIGRMRPELCFFENVEGHITLGLREVIGGLESLGYRTTWGLFSAAEVGAPHQRKRVFILADSAGVRGRQDHWIGNTGFTHQTHEVWPNRPNQPQFDWEPPRVVANADCRGLERTGADRQGTRDAVGDSGEGCEAVGNAQRAERRPLNDGISGQANEDSGDAASSSESVEHANSNGRERDVAGDAAQQGSNRQDNGVSCEAVSMERHTWQTQPTVGGNSDGPPSGLDYAQLCVSGDNRTDELRLLGNGVVPQCAAKAFTVLFNRLKNNLESGK